MITSDYNYFLNLLFFFKFNFLCSLFVIMHKFRSYEFLGIIFLFSVFYEAGLIRAEM